MRRMTKLVAWSLLAALLLTPVLPVRAQQVSPNLTSVIGPAGTLWYSAASQIVSNTTAATWLFSGTIPASLFSTGATSNFQSTNLGPANASIPLHLILEGIIDQLASPGTLNIGVNFGVGTTTRPSGCTAGSGANSCWFATAALANAVTTGPGAIVAGPVRIDVWLTPIATGTATNATPNIVNTVVLRSRLELPNSGTPATAIILNAGTIAQVNIASAHILNVVWQNGTLGNYLRIYKVILRQVD